MSNETSTVDQEITVKKCGIRLKPPAMIAYYERSDEGGRRMTRERVMPLRNFNATSDVKEFVQTLRERHHRVLGQVTSIQLERLARVIQLNMETDLALEECLVRANREYEINPDEDLNKVDGDVLRRKKEVMDETFLVNRKQPGDPDFQYDVQVNFDSVGNIETSGWDSDTNDSIF